MISPHFIEKNWPERELQGLGARQMIEGRQVILPIWHGVTKEQVIAFSPPLADTIAIDTERDDAQEITLKILQVVRPDLYDKHPRSELLRMASGDALEELKEEIETVREELEATQHELAEYQCPTCGAGQTLAIPVGREQEDFLVEYACGRSDSYYQSYLCPEDPKFPDLDQFKFSFESESREVHEGSLEDVPIPQRIQKLKELPKVVKTVWKLRVRGKTKEARATYLEGYGGAELSEQQALDFWLQWTWNRKVRKGLRRERVSLSEVDHEYVEH